MRSRPSSTSTSKSPGLRRAAGHRHARRMDERARLNAPLGCRSTHRRFHMWLVEGHQPMRSARDKRGHMRRQIRRRQVLLDRLLLVLNRIREERPRQLHEVGQALRTRTQQIEETMRHSPRLMRQRQTRPRAKNGSTARASSSTGIRAMYCPFIQSSFSVSNTAFPPLMPSSEKRSIELVQPTSARDRRPATTRAAPGSSPSPAAR